MNWISRWHAARSEGAGASLRRWPFAGDLKRSGSGPDRLRNLSGPGREGGRENAQARRLRRPAARLRGLTPPHQREACIDADDADLCRLRNEGTSLLWRPRGHSYVALTRQHYPIMGSLLQRAIQAGQVREMPAAWSLTCGDEQHHGKNGGRIGG